MISLIALAPANSRLLSVQERQHLGHCLLHTINNALQRAAFTPADLNRIADGLAPGRPPLPFLHPHRTIIWGNWDVSVLELALEEAGRSLKWHDQRDTAYETIGGDCEAAVVNVKGSGPLAALFGGRHWFTVKKSEDGESWYNLDSKLAEPALVGGAVELRDLLEELRASSDAKILLVVTKDT